MDRIIEPTSDQIRLGTLINEVVLASSSPNRRKLLEKSGIKVKPFTPSADESTDGYTIEEAMKKNAFLKMKAYLSSPSFDKSLHALSADTLVSIDGMLLGKPRDLSDAFSMLTRLSGRKQSVYTGCALYTPEDGRTTVFCDRADVIFRSLTPDDIKSYLALGEWEGAAGAYRLQKTGYTLVERIKGDWATVVGLPLKRIISLLSD